MNFKVLENTGTLTTSTEGASINKLNLLNKTGIIKGRLNELAITNTTSTLTINTGHLVINGLNLILEESTYFSVSPTSSRTTNYLIVEIIADGNGGITAELKLVNQYSEGSGLDFTCEIVSGTYRYLIAFVNINSSGITGVSKNVSVIEYDDYILYLSQYADAQTITEVISIMQSISGFRTTNFDIDINAQAFLGRDKIILDINGLDYTLIKQAVESELYIWSYILFNREREVGITLVYDGEEGTTTISVSSNYVNQPHLYEHNIVVGESATFRNSTDLATFKILTTSPTPFTNVGDIADLLHERNLSSITNCLTASGRDSSDSFSFDYDGGQETGYCESIVIGVYGDSDSDLHLVYYSLNENENQPVYSDYISVSYVNDTVVQIF